MTGSRAIANRWNVPQLGLGVGLRGKHIPTILRDRPAVGWFEVISDNALVHQGWLRHALDQLAEQYPLVLHGVTANLGSTDALDLDYLRGIKALADRWRVPWVSDHLCWTGVGGRQSHDLLPVPYSEEMLAWLTQRVRLVQDVLERPLVVENPSSYLQFHQTQMPEWTFLARLAEDADCGILLDVNNIYVASKNHAFAASDYLAAVPWERVCQMHVAGHTTLETHLFDSHIGPVDPPVWDVLEAAFAACGGRPLLLEWDFAIPSFAQTWREAQRAWDRVAHLVQPLPRAPEPPPRIPTTPVLADAPAAGALMHWMLDEVTGHPTGQPASQWIASQGRLTPDQRVTIHRAMYAARCQDALAEDFPRLRRALGPHDFAALAEGYRLDVPSTSWALEHYGARLADWMAASGKWPEKWVTLARLERAAVEAHLAPDVPPLTPDALQFPPGTDPGQLVLRFAPAAQLVRGTNGAWLVARSHWRVTRRRLARVEADLLEHLMAGAALETAMAGVATTPARQAALTRGVGQWLAGWVRSGAVAQVVLP